MTVRKAIRKVVQYPLVARRRRIEGRATLGIKVDHNGKVAEVRLVKSSRHGILDRTAISWALAIKNLPPPPGGSMDIIVPVDFNLNR
ncbi:MAG: energy transducer TonB [Deltaproteobacteria bacterium]|nr:energy transducer TonB [Deltaproteobacteria bacterium]